MVIKVKGGEEVDPFVVKEGGVGKECVEHLAVRQWRHTVPRGGSTPNVNGRSWLNLDEVLKNLQNLTKSDVWLAKRLAAPSTVASRGTYQKPLPEQQAPGWNRCRVHPRRYGTPPRSPNVPVLSEHSMFRANIISIELRRVTIGPRAPSSPRQG